MLDAALRLAERRHAETGSVEARARLLVERLRLGTLTPERIELAAFVGDEAARHVRPDAPRAGGDLVHFILAVECFGTEALLHVALVCARQLWTASFLSDHLEEWARCPCAKHRALIGAALRQWSAPEPEHPGFATYLASLASRQPRDELRSAIDSQLREWALAEKTAVPAR